MFLGRREEDRRFRTELQSAFPKLIGITFMNVIFACQSHSKKFELGCTSEGFVKEGFSLRQDYVLHPADRT
jgi:hypothetical protein